MDPGKNSLNIGKDKQANQLEPSIFHYRCVGVSHTYYYHEPCIMYCIKS